MNKFWNGDLESREHYVAYGIATLGLGFLGDKGLSKAGQVGKVAAITGFTKGKSLVINSLAYRNALHILNNYEFKAGNHLHMRESEVLSSTCRKQLHILMRVQMVRKQ